MTKSKINILIVDDHPEGLLAIEAILQSPEYNLIRAESGQEALKHLLNEKFALILMDVQMPDLDGFETVKLIKNREKSKNIPIIFLTALNKDDQHVYQGYHSGAVDYLCKPFDPEILRSKVKVFTGFYEIEETLRESQERILQSERELKTQALQALKFKSEERYRNLTNALPNLILIGKKSGELDYCNQAWIRYTGLSLQKSSGSGWKTSISSDHLAKLLHLWDQSIEEKGFYEMECQIKRHSDQTFRWNLLTIVHESKSDEEASSLVSATDIDDRKQLEIHLKRAVAIRDEFLTVASHELKTPITSLKLYLQLLGKKIVELGQDQLTFYVKKLEHQTNRLTVLIETFLNAELIYAGKITDQMDDTGLSEFFEKTVIRFIEENSLSSSQFEFKIAPHINLKCSQKKMEQLIFNLLSNAIKYGKGKKIHLQLIENKSSIEMRIQDQGIGINQEDFDRIFNRFERAVSSTHISGLGLGLYIANQIAKMHHGSITIDSEVEKGSAFIVTFYKNL